MIEDARGDIDYDEEGSGPTILFVPGSGGTRSAWRGVITALNRQFRIVTTSLAVTAMPGTRIVVYTPADEETRERLPLTRAPLG